MGPKYVGRIHGMVRRIINLNNNHQSIKNKIMRNTLILLIAMFAMTASAQKKIVWFDVGLKAQAGATGFFNTDISDHPDVNYELNLTNGFGIGGKLGVNFDYGGLALEAMYNRGSLILENNAPGESAPEYDWSSFDIYTLYKTNKNLGYFEIGPKISFLSSMDYDGADVKSDYNSPNFSGVLGFGANVIGSDGAFTGMLGLRFEYGFTDMVSDGGKERGAPLSNVNGFTTDSSTNPFFAGIVFELNWGVGYFGVAQCGQRSKFIMF